MRKLTACLLCLFIVMTAGAAYVVKALGSPADAVTFTEERLYGDISNLDGLTVKKPVTFMDRVYWDSTLTFKGDSFTSETKNYLEDVRKTYFVGQGESFMNLNNVARADYDDEFYNSLMAECEIGESVEKLVRLADYDHYYSYEMMIELNNLFYDYSPAVETNRDETDVTPEILAGRAVTDFFKIPILDQEYMKFVLEKTGPDQYTTTHEYHPEEIKDADIFYMNMVSAVSDDAIYLAFNNKSSLGQSVDTSEIPGGYGIYRLPYGERTKDYTYGNTTLLAPYMDVFTEELSVFYPMDEKNDFITMALSDDGKSLIYYAVEEDDLYGSVIDLGSGKQKDHILLYQGVKEKTDIFLSVEEGYHLLKVDDAYVVISEKEGSFQLEFCASLADFTRAGLDYPCEIEYNGLSAFDGKRLVLLGAIGRKQDDIIYDSTDCSFYLVVFDREGLRYYGNFNSSLEAINSYLYFGEDYKEGLRMPYRMPVKVYF